MFLLSSSCMYFTACDVRSVASNFVRVDYTNQGWTHVKLTDFNVDQMKPCTD